MDNAEQGGEWVTKPASAGYRAAPERVWVPYSWHKRLSLKVARLFQRQCPECLAPASVPVVFDSCKLCGGSGRVPRDFTVDPDDLKRSIGRAYQKSLPIFILVGVLGALFCVGSGLLWAIAKRPVTAEITHIAWSYTSELRQKTLFHDAGWWYTVPRDAFNEDCRWKYAGQDCTTRTHSDGSTYQDCESDYDRWCEYDHYEWPVVEARRTTGGTQRTFWPDLKAEPPDQRVERSTSYRVDFAAEGDTYTFRPATREEFRRYRKGARWAVRVNRLGSVEPTAPLENQ